MHKVKTDNKLLYATLSISDYGDNYEEIVEAMVTNINLKILDEINANDGKNITSKEMDKIIKLNNFKESINGILPFNGKIDPAATSTSGVSV